MAVPAAPISIIGCGILFKAFRSTLVSLLSDRLYRLIAFLHKALIISVLFEMLLEAGSAMVSTACLLGVLILICIIYKALYQVKVSIISSLLQRWFIFILPKSSSSVKLIWVPSFFLS